MFLLLSLFFTTKASLFKECSPLLKEHNLVKVQRQQEELEFLKKPLENVNRWNEQLIYKKSKIESKVDLTKRYCEKVLELSQTKSNPKDINHKYLHYKYSHINYLHLKNLSNIANDFYKVLKFNSWIQNKHLKKLQTYILDTKTERGIKNLDKMYEFFKNYKTQVEALVEICAMYGVLINNLDMENLSEDICNAKALLKEIYDIVLPSNNLVYDINTICVTLKSIKQETTATMCY